MPIPPAPFLRRPRDDVQVVQDLPARLVGYARIYGPKIVLKTLLNGTTGLQQTPSLVYGEQDVVISYVARDLFGNGGDLRQVES